MLLKSNHSIRSRLVLIFSIVFFGFLIIGYAYRTVLFMNANSEQTRAEILHISQLINQLELDIQRARQAEKNYLIEQDVKYFTEHNTILTNIHKKISSLKTVLPQENQTSVLTAGNRADMNTVIQSMKKLIDEYESGFRFVVEAKEKRQAAINSIHTLVKNIEEKILATGNLQLINSYLKMRGHEKDYVATQDYQYVTQLNFEMKEFASKLIDADMDDAKRNEISKLMNEYNLGMLALTNGTMTVANKIAGFNEIVQKLGPLMTELKNREKTQFETSRQRVEAGISKSNTLFIMTIVATGIIVLFFLFNTARYITLQIDGIISAIKQLSKGNLAIDLFENKDTDEISRLYNSLYKMKSGLTDIINGIRSSAKEVSTASEQVAQGNIHLSQRTQEQASSLEEMASSMEQMTGTVAQNADNAQQANQLAISARQQAEQGGEVVNKVVAAMTDINKSSHRIADIIGVIDGIAFQTNLLALNAAVEAARAGEQGRSFAVVASEVRNLAGRCKTSAKEIKDLVLDTMEKVESGTRLADASGVALTEILQSTKKVRDIVAEIAAASREQSEGISQVNKALLVMDDMTQQNAALMEQAAAASESMQNQAHDLNTLVEYFKVAENTKHPEPDVMVESKLSSTDKNTAQNAINVVTPKTGMTFKKDTALPVVMTTFDRNSDNWRDFPKESYLN